MISFCGLFIWLEFGTMFPRSGGEKVYLEAVYRRPRHLATVIFAANAIFLTFSSGNCIVSPLSNQLSILIPRFVKVFAEKYVFQGCFHLKWYLMAPISVLVAAGHNADRWVVRGVAIGGT